MASVPSQNLKSYRNGFGYKQALSAGLLVLAIAVGAAVAFFPPSVMYLAGTVVVAWALAMPYAGLQFVTAILPFEHYASLTGFLSVTKLIGAAMMAGLVARVLLRQLKLVLDWQMAPLAGFAGFSLLSGFWAANPSTWLEQSTTYVQLLLFLVLTATIMNSEKRLRALTLTMIASSALSGGLGLFQYYSLELGRLIGGRGNPNEAAMFAATTVPLVINYLAAGKNPLTKPLLLISLGVLLLTVVLTFSRGGYIALLVVLLLVAIRGRNKMRSVLLISACAGLVYALAPQEQVETRAGSIVTMEDRGAGRLDLWLVGLNMFRENPIVGVGSASFSTAYWRYESLTQGVTRDPEGIGAHNTYLSLLDELGIIGFGLYAAGVTLAFRNLGEALRLVKRGIPLGQDSLVVSLQISLIGMLAAAVFSVYDYYKYVWLLLALCIVVKRLAREQIAQLDWDSAPRQWRENSNQCAESVVRCILTEQSRWTTGCSGE
ncbi:MAG: O-antigen ligase family protein [Chloroflexi bacterium]|nr:O-antigen ligase family protein [Chloroflexota bacterium]